MGLRDTFERLATEFAYDLIGRLSAMPLSEVGRWLAPDRHAVKRRASRLRGGGSRQTAGRVAAPAGPRLVPRRPSPWTNDTSEEE